MPTHSAAREAFWLRQEALSRAEDAHQALCDELRAQGVKSWWPHHKPGMSMVTWCDEVEKTRRRRSGMSTYSREGDIESGRRRYR